MSCPRVGMRVTAETRKYSMRVAVEGACVSEPSRRQEPCERRGHWRLAEEGARELAGMHAQEGACTRACLWTSEVASKVPGLRPSQLWSVCGMCTVR